MVPRHVPGVINVAADALSRNNMLLFHSLVPQAARSIVGTSTHGVAGFAEAGLGLSGLDCSVQSYLMRALAPRTLQSYRSAIHTYLVFCHSFGVPSPFPLSELVLCRFVAFLGSKGLTYALYPGISQCSPVLPNLPEPP